MSWRIDRVLGYARIYICVSVRNRNWHSRFFSFLRKFEFIYFVCWKQVILEHSIKNPFLYLSTIHLLSIFRYKYWELYWWTNYQFLQFLFLYFISSILSETITSKNIYLSILIWSLRTFLEKLLQIHLAN